MFDFKNWSRSISQMHFFLSKICPSDSFSRCLIFKMRSFADFSNDAFDFQIFVAFDFPNGTLLISKICPREDKQISVKVRELNARGSLRRQY